MTLKAKIAGSAVLLSFFALGATSAQALQVDVVVDKSTQHMKVMVDGALKYDWLVSTGGRGYETPSGQFHVFRMEEDHFSQEWDNAPMPHSMFFTGIGHALHGSFHVKTLGVAVSHGCVRISPENAAVLWELMSKAGPKHNSVKITGGGFFENADLTTEKTFNMKPNEFGHRSAMADPAPSGGLFWWQKRDASASDSRPVTSTNFGGAQTIQSNGGDQPKTGKRNKIVKVAAASSEPPEHPKVKKTRGKKKAEANFFDFLKGEQ